MKLAESTTSQSARDLIEKLSTRQLAAVFPVLQALSELVSSVPAEPPPPLPPVAPIAVELNGALHAPSQNHSMLEKLRSVEAHFERALAMDPAPARDEQLSGGLAMLRFELSKLESEQTTGLLSSPSMPAVDATTGLPTRPIFERHVAKALEDRRNVVIALFVIERLPYVNKRFGRLAGDEILLFVAQHLASDLADTNSFCRWTGPAFVALFEIGKDIETVERKIQAIAAKQLSKSLEAGGRSVMLPISCSYLVERLSSEGRPADLFTRMDDFVANYLRE